MNTPIHTLRVLELPKVLERLAEFADFSLSRSRALQLEPATGRETVTAAIEETSQARRALEAAPNLNVSSARDISPELDAAEKSARLDPTALLRVADTVRSGNRLKNALGRLSDAAPILADLVGRIEPLHDPLEAIVASIDDDGSIMDSASRRLAQLRSESKAVHDRLLRRMQKMVASPSYGRFLQESIYTQRSGRYVLPIKQELRPEFEGIVHDVSSSGATVFMEPLELVEANNDWRRLRIEEKNEEERILQALSGRVGSVAREARENLWVIAAVDLALAKARYGIHIHAIAPEIAADTSFELVRARHPLLDDDAVPIDIRLESGGGGFRALLITGPNTGGKTVALKCVGLLHLMAACGLHVPAGDGTTLAAYESIFADVGDEQSIEQSLSTFSSHMRNLVEMVQGADAGSLVLADEIGAGTDPVEGAALAQAIVERLLENGAALVATTHYAALKNFAYSDPRVENASVEFDTETLAPTFEVRVGLPGRSNATEIATRLGLDPEIVRRARDLAGQDHRESEGLISDIRDRADEAERLRLEAERLAEEAQAISDRAEAEHADSSERIADERRLARRRTRSVLREIEALAKKARKSGRGEEGAKAAELASKGRSLAQKLDEPGPGEPDAVDDGGDATAFRAGDRVTISGIQSTGEVLSVDIASREAEVAVGSARMRVATRDLRSTPGRSTKPTPRRDSRRSNRDEMPPLEAQIRGIRTEETAHEVDRLIDRALLESRRELRIVHGSGTGALRASVRRYLADHPLVKTYSDAGPRDGGSGVTVVMLGG